MTLTALKPRILLGAILSAFVTLVMVVFSGHLIHRVGLNPGDWALPDEAIAACEADPATFKRGALNLVEVYAYDLAGVSANPSAPPFGNPRLLARVQADNGAAGWINRKRVLAVRAADSGPCAIMKIVSTPPKSAVQRVVVGFGIGGAATMLLVGWLTWMLTVRPLVARIERIRDAAHDVGADRYRAAEDSQDDALTEIVEALERSHERITADRAELVLRHEALERHLAEIAHDLRTPLASLLLAMQDLSAEVDGGPAQAAANRAIGDAAYVSSLVENLHHAARLRHGLVATEGQTDLTSLVRRLGVRFAALGAHQGTQVATATPDDRILVACTPSIAERAIANLIHNALAHGGSHVAVVLEAHADGFLLSIADNGTELADTDAHDLAARTFAADAARPRGPGLGVAIANEVARQVAWEISYTAPEGGLRVEIRGQVRSQPEDLTGNCRGQVRRQGHGL